MWVGVGVGVWGVGVGVWGVGVGGCGWVWGVGGCWNVWLCTYILLLGLAQLGDS